MWTSEFATGAGGGAGAGVGEGAGVVALFGLTAGVLGGLGAVAGVFGGIPAVAGGFVAWGVTGGCVLLFVREVPGVTGAAAVPILDCWEL